MKIVSKARQVRLDYQSRLGRPVSLSEVAEQSHVDRMALSRLERKTRINRVDMGMIARLCAYYGVEIGDLLEYNPDDTRSPSHAAELIPA